MHMRAARKCGAAVLLSVGILDALATTARADSLTVHVFNNDFSINPQCEPIVDPPINAGDTLHFVFDSGFHSVQSLIGSPDVFDSGDHDPGFTFDHKFSQPGVFYYFCDLHGVDNGDGTASGMAGSVTV